MLLLIISSAAAAALGVWFVASLVTARPAAVGRRIKEVRELTSNAFSPVARQRREDIRQRVEAVIELIGSTIARHSGSARTVRDMLTHAGYRSGRAESLFW